MSTKKKKLIAIILLIISILIVAAVTTIIVAISLNKDDNTKTGNYSDIDNDKDEDENDSLETVIPPGERLNKFIDSLMEYSVVHMTYTVNVDGKDVVYDEYYSEKATYTEYTLDGKQYKILKNSDGQFELDTAAKTYKTTDLDVPCLISKMISLRNPEFAIYEFNVEKIDNAFYNYDQVDTGTDKLRAYFSVSTDKVRLIRYNDKDFDRVTAEDDPGSAVFSLKDYAAR